jgi:hypothetical protein
MKRMILAAAVAAVFATPALAGDPLAVGYGNTVTQTFQDGTVVVVYVNADKTWEQHRGGQVVKGTFTIQDDTHACFTVTDPAPADPSKATNCIEVKGDHKVGDTWTEPLPNGASMTVSITAGRS